MLNNIQLQGRLTSDPTVTTPGNATKVMFTLAVADDFSKDKTHFIRCSAWNKTGEFLAKHFHKGDMVIVSGRLTSFKPKDSAYESMEVNVTNVYFCTSSQKQKKEEPEEDPSEFEIHEVGDLPF